MSLPLNTLVFANPDAVARAAADRIIALFGADTERDRFAIALSGGSTPKRLYSLLVSDEYRDRVDWERIHWFWGDERFVPSTDPDSNERMVRETMLDHVSILPGFIHNPPVFSSDLNAAAAAYDAEMKAFYGSDHLDPNRPLFDIVLLGLGDDGHTASLFPGKPAVEETTLWIAPVPEAGMKPFVPRLTLTLPAIASSREVLFLAVGESKREMLAKVAAGADLPSARVTSRGKVEWFVDHAAAAA
jgi:6-phosphogluconolactonase